MAKLSIVRPGAGEPPPRSEAREKLAAALARRQEAEAESARLYAARESVGASVAAAMERVERAEVALAAAKGAASSQLLALADGTAPPSLQSVGAARRELEDARDAADVARATRDGMPALIERADQEAERARAATRRAAAAVLRESPAVVATVVRVEQLQRDLVSALRALDFLAGRDVIPDGRPRAGGHGERDQLAIRCSSALGRSLAPVGHWNGLQADPQLAGERPWQEATAALLDDPDAALPGDAG